MHLLTGKTISAKLSTGEASRGTWTGCHKQRNEGIKSRVANFMFFIAYGWGFMKLHHRTTSINGETIKTYIVQHFPSMLEIHPAQRLKYSFGVVIYQRTAFRQKRLWKLLNATYSKHLQNLRTLNLIENVFNNIRAKISKESNEKRHSKNNIWKAL